jgi:peroxiredoxin
MKKILKITIPILFLSVLGYVGYKIVTQINHKKDVAENIKTIPVFSYETTDNKVFTNNDLENNKQTTFVYFNTECEFCNEEAKMIKENIEKFKNTQILFISFEDKTIIKEFATQHQLLDYDNVSFLCDSKATFAITFDVKSLPCLVLYDKNQQLIEKIKGQIKAEVLIKKLNLE